MFLRRWISFGLSLIFLSNAIYVSAVTQADFAVYLSYSLALLLSLYGYFYRTINQISGPIRKLIQLSQISFIIWLLSFLIFCLYLHHISKPSYVQPDIDAILVFGGGVDMNQPSPTLALRLEQALRLAQQIPDVPIIVSGGQASADLLSEAEVMQQYLITHGMNKTRIYLEAKSTSTQTNLKYSQPILRTLGLNRHSKLAFVSSDFHLARIAAIAKQQDYANFLLIAAATPRDLALNAYLREYFAYISGFVLREY